MPLNSEFLWGQACFLSSHLRYLLLFLPTLIWWTRDMLCLSTSLHLIWFLLWWVWVSEVAQLCLTLCDPMDCSPPGSSIHGILQERILEWVAISFSRGSSWPRDRTQVPHIACRLFTFWPIGEDYIYIYIYIFNWSIYTMYFEKLLVSVLSSICK